MVQLKPRVLHRPKELPVHEKLQAGAAFDDIPRRGREGVIQIPKEGRDRHEKYCALHARILPQSRGEWKFIFPRPIASMGFVVARDR